MKKVLVIGGKGSLGSAVLRRFKQSGSKWTTYSFDISTNSSEHVDVEISPSYGMKWESVVDWIHERLQKEPKFDSIITAAGGFVPGDIDAPISCFESNWKMNARSAFLSAQLASKYLSQEKSLFLLTGAKAALEQGPDFAIGYGLSKAATHHLAKSVESKMNTVCILPGVLDTPGNRMAMPDADFSSWTNMDLVAGKIYDWSENPDLVKSELFIEV